MIGLGLILAAGAVAGAETWFVDANHARSADTNAGTAGAPFLTIGAAARCVKPGGTVVIRGGTYRECIRLGARGAPGQPITFRAAPGERVILSGAEKLTGWRKCTTAEVGNHPQADKLFAVDTPWLPARLFEGRGQMTLARTPDVGWWRITDGLSLSEFADTVHLTQTDAHAWDGWTVAVLDQAGGGSAHVAVKAFDPAAHTITLAADYSRFRKKIDAKRDRYYFENHLSALDGPGQYVFRQTEGGYRLIIWPSRLGHDGLPLVEAPRLTTLFQLTNLANVVIDGLEICLSANYGLGMGSSGSPVQVTIQNCYVHDNEGYGIEMRQPVKCLLRRNIIWRNSHGIVMSGSRDTVIEENDIGWNQVDGIDAPNGTRNLTVRRNYIHDHYLWGHPDNIQFWADVEGVDIRDNVMVNAGQTMMSADMRNARLINNVWLGSRAISMIAGGDGWEISGNTVCATGPMPTNLGGRHFVLRDNIFAPLHEGPIYGMSDPETFRADHNLLWAGSGHSRALVVKGAWKDAAATVAEIRAKFGQETNGVVADPGFRHAAKAFAATDYARVTECTTSRFVLRDNAARMFGVGDHVELDFDGVPRRVIEVGPDFLVVDQPLAAPPVTVQSVANWGATSDFRWDLRPADDSPARRSGSGGRDMGSSLSVQDYVKGDFDGDGKRDLPEMPAE